MTGAAHTPRTARLLPTVLLTDAQRPVGRPRGEVAELLLDAVARLSTDQRGPTALELACDTQIGKLACEQTLGNLVRRGRMRILRRRWVAYRRSPVAEYAVVTPDDQAALAERAEGVARLAMTMQTLGRSAP